MRWNLLASIIIWASSFYPYRLNTWFSVLIYGAKYSRTDQVKLMKKVCKKFEVTWSGKPIKCQCCPHIEGSQLIWTANQLIGFYMKAILALNGLSRTCPFRFFKCYFAQIFLGLFLNTLSHMFLWHDLVMVFISIPTVQVWIFHWFFHSLFNFRMTTVYVMNEFLKRFFCTSVQIQKISSQYLSHLFIFPCEGKWK